MKRYIPLLLGLAVMGLFILGCETIVDQEPIHGALQSTEELTGESTFSFELTREMCMDYPGWRALGYRNLGQCIRYAQSGTGNPPIPPTITDIEGNVYPIVKIGDQWWMAENLRVTRYRNGDEIPTGFSNEEWSELSSGAYAIYPHTGGGVTENDVEGIENDEEMLRAYGALYNWYAVDDDGGLCPVGWRVPTDDEWKQLEMYLGMSEIDAYKTGWDRGNYEGNKLKSTRTEPESHPRWDLPNEGATNEYGWSGLPGGSRPDEFHLIGTGGYWWTSTQCTWQEPEPINDMIHARYRALPHDAGMIFRGPHEYDVRKHVGMSVRCIMD